MRYDVVVVGGGLAGACAALWLSDSCSVAMLEVNEAANAASGAAAGLVNPIKGLRATPMWRCKEALEALHRTLEVSGAGHLFRATGVLRPALDSSQADYFQNAAFKYSDQTEWLTHETVCARYPDVEAPFGGLWIASGGAVSLSAFTLAMLDAAERCGADIYTGARLTGWKENDRECRVETNGGSFKAKNLLLCLGDGFSAFPKLTELPLHKIKGQTIRLLKPEALPGDLPAISGGVYIVPDSDELVVGSTFEHDFTHLEPDPELGESLREKAALLIPSLSDVAIIDQRAGIRVTIPRVRLPMLGPLPGSKRTWIFTGLGAKGLMTAPLLARDLAAFLADPKKLPVEVRPPG